MSTVDKAWEALERATASYREAGDAVLAGDPVETLRAIFASGNSHHAAIRLIGDRAPERPELVREFLPELFDTALSDSPISQRARYILAALPPEVRNPHLEAVTAREIANPDPDRWEELRGLAVLLERVDRLDLLEQLKDAVRDSPEEALRDIAEDFPQHS
ncbi:hypothetical protein LWC34_33790 [Kibdelosporangium philippinense]|uniref:HEAT repeat domain-containing protein n=1 Tax=Kibdelosporangium philippinense TaxID=211113 RepID=A0ABS8ZJN9_9PSEU|nr:hypothetical protein [Kibdelosporangium philippinense]MCE7007757.1 hypothetical protein [Kibdelosporangium philippinense]